LRATAACTFGLPAASKSVSSASAVRAGVATASRQACGHAKHGHDTESDTHGKSMTDFAFESQPIQGELVATGRKAFRKGRAAGAFFAK
jgi:hypothetical protein